MAVFRIALIEDEHRAVNVERDSHPVAHVRRKMLVVWLVHCGLTRTKAAEISGRSRPTVQRYVAAFRSGGLDGLRRWGVRGPVSDLVAHTTAIREALTTRPVRTAAEAAEQIQCDRRQLRLVHPHAAVAAGDIEDLTRPVPGTDADC